MAMQQATIYADRQLARQHVHALLGLAPQMWVVAAHAHLAAAQAAGESNAQLSVLSSTDVLLAREM